MTGRYSWKLILLLNPTGCIWAGRSGRLAVKMEVRRNRFTGFESKLLNFLSARGIAFLGCDAISMSHDGPW